MTHFNIDDVIPEELPRDKQYYLELNEKLKQYGLPTLVVDDDYVYKDEIHKLLDIGIPLEG